VTHPRPLVAALAALLGLALTGCPPNYPKCKEDKHCEAKGEVCVEGLCKECSTDTNCKEGFLCKANACVPVPQCRVDGDCGDGKRCRAERCVAQCSSDRECASTEQCRSGRCVDVNACRTDADCSEGGSCKAGRCERPAAEATVPDARPPEDDAEAARLRALASCTLERVSFEFNAFSLSDAARALLDRGAECIKFRKQAVVLAGHADERGTEEYNLVLGERRANAVKRYLAGLGVDEASLRTISYGEEKPLDPAQSESAWATNRRVELTFK
jgi:peptidoglycan-associated lipoprotein